MNKLQMSESNHLNGKKNSNKKAACELMFLEFYCLVTTALWLMLVYVFGSTIRTSLSSSMFAKSIGNWRRRGPHC